MATIIIKNIPNQLYQRLKLLAKSHHRSISDEVIHCLDMALHPKRISATEWLRRFHAIRPNVDPDAVTLEELQQAVKTGRP